jgi:hypothetical protein
MKHPPGIEDHEICVVVNGGLARNSELENRFAPLECQILRHDNTGKDVGAFMKAAAEVRCDLMVCLGAPVHFHRAGWLDRIIQEYEANGPGLYGCWAFEQPRAHIRTTAFWCAPELLAAYPIPVHNGNRYEFEHGATGFTACVAGLGLGTFQVTWDGCYPRKEWQHASRTQSLVWDQHIERNKVA